MDKHYPPPFFDVARPFPSKAWKKKYKCKKNKGDHTFEIDVIRPMTIYWDREDRVPYWVEWRCTGCKKVAIEWRAPEKKFDKYRNTIYQQLRA